MYGGLLQTRIQYGYAKCAQKVGAPFFLYRSSTPINPISSSNFLGIILSSSNVSWEYMTTQKYGKAVWNLIIDTQLSSTIHAKPGDYIVPMPWNYYSTSGFNDAIEFGFNSVGAYATDVNPLVDILVEDRNIYFIGSTDYLLPILGVNCNSTISVIRPTQTIGAGYEGYAEYLPDTAVTIMTSMPASVLEIGSAGMAPTKLPTDANEPRWIILIPNLGNVIVRVDDIVIDQFNQEYVIIDNELTSLGWRILAEQVVNSR